jgi:hypothetical protein
MKPEQIPAGEHENQGKDFVDISVNGTTYQIHRGHQPVAAIKLVGGIPAVYELEQVVNGQLTPLPDEGAVVIKGGEKFVAHPRSAASS